MGQPLSFQSRNPHSRRNSCLPFLASSVAEPICGSYRSIRALIIMDIRFHGFRVCNIQAAPQMSFHSNALLNSSSVVYAPLAVFIKMELGFHLAESSIG